MQAIMLPYGCLEYRQPIFSECRLLRRCFSSFIFIYIMDLWHSSRLSPSKCFQLQALFHDQQVYDDDEQFHVHFLR